jgi:hypothetical protein
LSQAAGEACRRAPIGPAQGLAIADALKDEPINHAALTWEATARLEGLPAMVQKWERLYDKIGSRQMRSDSKLLDILANSARDSFILALDSPAAAATSVFTSAAI